jgi:hypothetical protein
MTAVEEIRAMAPTGVVGSGFPEEPFWAAVRGFRPDFIASDAGSIDPGPHALGSAQPKYPARACKRDLELMILAAKELGVPVIIGSAGTSGADRCVDWMRDIAEEIACHAGFRLKVATIYSEQSSAYLQEKLGQDKIRPLSPSGPIGNATIARATRIVGMMGAEPISAALLEGADLVIAGRATDASLFAAYPQIHGADAGQAWHAAKILECGAGAVEERTAPDGLLATIGPGYFEVEPVNPTMRCTPTSVAAHSLYENADPYLLREPSGTVDTRDSVYAAVSDRRVRVTGSRFVEAEDYSIRLEGVESIGYQSIVLAGIRDPLLIEHLDVFLAEVEDRARTRIIRGLGISDADYALAFRVYGRDAVMGIQDPARDQIGHEVGLVIEVTASTQELATGIVSMVSHTALHNPIPGRPGFVSALAYPYSPAEVERGEIYRFTVNHVVLPDDPHEPFRTRIETLGS